MDLIYTNENREDVGVLFGYSFDLAFGIDENDFECKLSVEKLREASEPDNSTNAVAGFAVVGLAIVGTSFKTATA